MKNLIREIPLSNGLTVRFFDATRRYFGDYHQVRISIICDVPVSSAHFDDATSHQSALKLLGASVQYRKDVEQQGVATLQTSAAVENVIQQFLNHSLSYFETQSFPKRFIQSELNRIGAKARSFVPLRANV
jgi:hypothetical protein